MPIGLYEFFSDFDTIRKDIYIGGRAAVHLLKVRNEFYIRMDIAEALTSCLIKDIPYPFLVEAVTPFLNTTALEELMVVAFHLRNVRGGKGERQLFRDMMSIFYEYDKSLVISVLPLLPVFGYWKDVFYLSMTLPHLLVPTMQLCAMQLIEDEHRVQLGYKPSMMAKYIPKQKKKYKSFATSFAKHLYPDIDCHSLRMAKTRKRIAALNSLTGAVEVKMCANDWVSIEQRSVPAIARKKYESAFLNRTKEGGVRSFSEDRELCRENYIEFMHERRTWKEPIEFTVASEVYNPVRATVKYWISSSLNTVD